MNYSFGPQAHPDFEMVMFDGILGGYVSMMPLLRDEVGNYRDLVEGEIVRITVQLR